MTARRNLATIGAVLGSALGCTTAALAAPDSPAALGMGSAYFAVARDYEAAHLNPANLALSDNAAWSLQILGVSAQLGNSSLSLADYQKYNGAELSEADKADIMAKIRGDELRIDLQGDVSGLSSSFGGYAISASTVALASGGIPRDLVDLLLYGNDLNRTYRFSEATGTAVALSQLGISASRPLAAAAEVSPFDEVAVGGTVKILRGWYYARITEAEGELVTTMDGASGRGVLVTRTGENGSGYGIDLGVAARQGGWTLGLAVENILGRVSWQGGEEDRRSFQAVDLNGTTLGDGSDLVEETEETIEIGAFETGLPRLLRLGMAHTHDSWTLALDYTQGWSGSGLDPARAALGAGSAYRAAPWVELRTGVRLEDERQVAISGGVGLEGGSTRVDLAIVSKGGVLPAQNEGIGVALGFGLLFR